MWKHATLIFTLSLLPTPALADSLDGDWCHADHGKLTIDGSTIITPAGRKLTGEYGRHRFIYDAPAGGWNGGKRIVIQQFSDHLMELKAGEGNAAPWKPCVVVS